MVATLSKGCETEKPQLLSTLALAEELKSLQEQVKEALGSKDTSTFESIKSEKAKVAFVLLYAHLLRLPVTSSDLKSVQRELVLQTPLLLGSLLAMSLGHNWLPTSIDIMHLHACFTQAVTPGRSPLLQYPFITEEEIAEAKEKGLPGLVSDLKVKGDTRLKNVETVASHWGKLEVVDAQFRGSY